VDEAGQRSRVREVLAVLVQAGVVNEVGGGFRLTRPFAALVPGSSGVTLTAVLAAVQLDLEDLDRGQPRVDGEAALIVALDSGVAADEVTQNLYRSVYDAIPEVAAVLNGSGPMLDLGCGVGGALLSTAQLYPQLRLVGVDIFPEVVAETVRRRDALGLSEQVQVCCADARELTERRVYPIAYWAQAFFSDQARRATLASLRQALTEDGLLIMQEQPASPIEVVQQSRRGIAAGRTADELAKEAEEAGFELIRQVATNVGNLTVMRNQP
jgi:SAM-dependent methyltransferase